MARPRTKRRLYVVFDTNAIFNKSTERILSDESIAVIREHSNHGDLDVIWIIPDIVKKEREFQMRTGFRDLISPVLRAAKVLGKDWDISEDILNAKLSTSIENQLSELRVKVQEPDVSTIDWRRLMDSAAFRLAPFEKGQTEKGFRDAIVCETFLQIASTTRGKDTAALVTNDRLILQAIRERMPLCKVLNGLEELRDEINLRVSNVDEETVKIIEKKAHLAFYVKGDHKTIWYKKGIWDIINGPKYAPVIKATPPGSTWQLSKHAIPSTRLVSKQGNRVSFATKYVIVGKSRTWVPAGDSDLAPEKLAQMSSWITSLRVPQDTAGNTRTGSIPRPSGATDKLGDTSVTGAPLGALRNSVAMPQSSSKLKPVGGLLGFLGNGKHEEVELTPIYLAIRWDATYTRQKTLTHVEIVDIRFVDADGVDMPSVLDDMKPVQQPDA